MTNITKFSRYIFSFSIGLFWRFFRIPPMPGKNLTTYWPQSPRVIENSVCFMRLTIRIKKRQIGLPICLCRVGVARFELATPWTPFKYATKLRYTPLSARTGVIIVIQLLFVNIYFLNLKSLDFYELLFTDFHSVQGQSGNEAVHRDRVNGKRACFQMSLKATYNIQIKYN